MDKVLEKRFEEIYKDIFPKRKDEQFKQILKTILFFLF